MKEKIVTVAYITWPWMRRILISIDLLTVPGSPRAPSDHVIEPYVWETPPETNGKRNSRRPRSLLLPVVLYRHRSRKMMSKLWYRMSFAVIIAFTVSITVAIGMWTAVGQGREPLHVVSVDGQSPRDGVRCATIRQPEVVTSLNNAR